jgi:hypothetical protein
MQIAVKKPLRAQPPLFRSIFQPPRDCRTHIAILTYLCVAVRGISHEHTLSIPGVISGTRKTTHTPYSPPPPPLLLPHTPAWHLLATWRAPDNWTLTPPLPRTPKRASLNDGLEKQTETAKNTGSSLLRLSSRKCPVYRAVIHPPYSSCV